MNDPVNDMTVKEYNAMKIQEKKDELSGAKKHLFDTLNSIAILEKELIDLALEQVNGYQFPTLPPPTRAKGE